MAEDTERNIAAQVEMYGEPLAAIFGRLTEGLGLSQAQLARVLGMSPAMLSHLGSGTRVKIGNPAVQRRLEEVQQLLGGVHGGKVPASGIPSRLEAIRESTGSWTANRHAGTEQGGARDEPRDDVDRDTVEAGTVGDLLRAVATKAQLRSAAELLAADHPGLAELVNVYGLGSVEEAARHLRQHRELF